MVSVLDMLMILVLSILLDPEEKSLLIYIEKVIQTVEFEPPPSKLQF